MAGRTGPRIVVLGGGFGGLETAFYLKWRLGDRAAVTLVSDRGRFLFKPNTIYIPFGLDPERLTIPLARPLARKGITFAHGRAEAIDPQTRTVALAGGGRLGYDYLVVATGAGMRPDEVPGLAEHAQTIWTPEDMLRLRGAFAALRGVGPYEPRRRVLFLVPPNNKCSGPLYELVQMLDTWLRRSGAREGVALTWSTYEGGYLQAFGPRLHAAVTREFARRGIAGFTDYAVDRVEPGRVRYRNGAALPYDLLVAFPPYAASTPFPGLPADERGFLRTDPATRQVVGHPDVYAAGDAGDFPVKQAFLAFLQADAVAEHLAARVLGAPAPAGFAPTSMCVMEQFDTATFAQVPLRLTGEPARPVEVDPRQRSQYLLGTSPLWRAGKWLLGVYLPWRFRNGEPFHAGLPWRGMDLGLRAMSALLARPPAPGAALAPPETLGAAAPRPSRPRPGSRCPPPRRPSADPAEEDDDAHDERPD